MFDKLFEILITIWTDIVPWRVITEMEKACVLRWGKFHRVLNPGFYLKIPFVDNVYAYHVKTRTTHLFSQTLTTLDSKTIVLKVVARYHIEDVKLYTIEVWDAHDAVNDTIQGIVGSIVRTHNWVEVEKGIEEEVMKQASEFLGKWGIVVEKITLADLATIKTIRLINQ